MTTSNSYNYNVTAAQILQEAMGIVGVYELGTTLNTTLVADLLVTLNFMVKAFQARGYDFYRKRECTLFLQDATSSYSLGRTGDHITLSAVKTEVATAASSGASTLVVDSITGFGNTFDRDGIITSVKPGGAGAITLSGALVTSSVAYMTSGRKILVYSSGDDSGVTFTIVGTDEDGSAVTEVITGPNTTTVYSTYEYKTVTSVTISGANLTNLNVAGCGDFIGIELDDGTIQWTNIGAAVSTTTITLITTLTDDVAVDNHVYTYTTKAPRPLEIIEARIHKSDDSETVLGMVSRMEYQMLPIKTSAGTPNQAWFELLQTNAKLYIWPVCNNVKEYIKLTAHLSISDLDASTDNFEIAPEFFEMLAWNLAVRLFPKFNKPIDQSVAALAIQFAESAFRTMGEPDSIFIGVR